MNTELIQSLTDRAQITDMVYRLAAGLDEHRFDDVRDLFVEDAVVQTPGGTAHGRDALVEQATRNHRDYDRLQHLVTGVLVELDGDRAAVRANLVGVFGRAADPEPERLRGAVYP